MAATPKNVNIADINSAAVAADNLPLDIMGLFFFAYRDFTGDADALLGRQDFGRAHHRVLYFVNLRPGMPPVAPESGVHICLRARSTEAVDAFHAAALSAGGRSSGAPGLRPHERVKYYAAVIVDPDGNRIEAVTFPSD